jgi:hypothetical protein
MINRGMEFLMLVAKKKKKIKSIPSAPKARELVIRDVYKKGKIVMEVMEVYSLFRKIPEIEKVREHEFRKNVSLVINIAGKEIRINMDKLK